MATWTVGAGGNFGTIAAAMASASVVAGDTIELINNYRNETATVTKQNLRFDGQAGSVSISLTLAVGVANLVLTGAAAINVTGNAVNNVITGNDAANVLNGGGGPTRSAMPTPLPVSR